MRKIKSIFSLEGGWLVVLWLCSLARADQWEFFHPELVRKYGCYVRQVDLQANGMDHGTMIWDAEAFADRADQSHWIYEVARYPLTLKGRHQAEKACSKWTDDAEKRVRKAQ
jgi:hypothetical protein